jgi:hypothetical protein
MTVPRRAFNPPITAPGNGEGGGERTSEFEGRDDLDGHDGLEDDGIRLEVRLAERVDGGEAERELGRVDRVECFIAKDHAHSGDWVPRQRALLDRFKEALLDRGDVVARYIHPLTMPDSPTRPIGSMCPIIHSYCSVPPVCLCVYANSARSVTVSRADRPVVRATPHSRFIRLT